MVQLDWIIPHPNIHIQAEQACEMRYVGCCLLNGVCHMDLLVQLQHVFGLEVWSHLNF